MFPGNSLTALLDRLLSLPSLSLQLTPWMASSPRCLRFPAHLSGVNLRTISRGFISASRTEVAREKLDWGCYVALLLILSTNPASYDFNGLILTAVWWSGTC